MTGESEAADTITECANKCSNTLGCTHFVMGQSTTKKNICWKYSGIVNDKIVIMDHSGYRCGVLDNQYNMSKNSNSNLFYK